MNRMSTGIKKNLAFSIVSQLIIIALGLILPRLILVSYGSEINGLLNAVTQIFTYAALLEAGIGNASVNALYKPIVEKNNDRISEVVSATRKYYRKITRIYLVVIFAASIFYPLFLSTELSYITIALVMFFQGLAGAVGFYFTATYKQLLISDGKNYVISTIELFVYVLTSFIKIILMFNGISIVLLQVAYFTIALFQAFLFNIWIKKKYKKIKIVNNPNMGLLAQRYSFVVHEISSVIFSSTDVFVLSTFCSLKVASIYSIYNMVYISIKRIINSVNGSLNYILGQTFAKDKKLYEELHDVYDSLNITLGFSLMTVVYLLIIPFVSIYTRNINDIDYIDYYLPILFTSIELLSCGRIASSRLITISGHAKATLWRSVTETLLNLFISLSLVNIIGIYGVLLGTIVALLYRTNDIIFYANKKILRRSPWKTYKLFLPNIFVFIAVVFIEKLFRNILMLVSSFSQFLIYGMISTIVSVLLYSGVAVLVNKQVIHYLRILYQKKQYRER